MTRSGAYVLGQTINRGHRLAKDLVAAWVPIPSYARGSRLVDLNYKKYLGTLTNGPLWCSGPYGMPAINFDGTDDNVSMGTTVSGLRADTFSFACWAWKDSTPGAGLAFGIAGYGQSSWYVRFTEAANGSGLELLVSNVASVGFSTTALSVKTWYRIGLSVSSSGGTQTCTFYVNGAPDGAPTTGTSFAAGTDPFRLGCDGPTGSTAEFLPGRITGALAWSRTLGADEFRMDYAEARSGYRNLLNLTSDRYLAYSPTTTPVNSLVPRRGQRRFRQPTLLRM